MAASQSREKQPKHGLVRSQFIPDVFTAKRLDRLDAGFSTPPPLRHALGRFEAVKIVRIHAAVTDAETLRQACMQRHLDGWNSPCYRKRRPGQERKAQSF